MFLSLICDLHFGLRRLRRSPYFALTSILTLALGMGATSAVYSLVDGVLLRPFPLPRPEQLVAVHTLVREPGGQPSWSDTSWPDYLDWRARNHTFSGIAGVLGDNRLISRENGAEGAVLPIDRVSTDYFDVLGARPMMGRNFVTSDERAGYHVAIVSYGYWQRVFGGDPRVVGQIILISDEPYTVIGVMPRGFVEPRDETAEVWSNIALMLEGSTPKGKTRDSPIAEVVGRLKPGVTQEEAQADLSAIQAALAQSYHEIRFQNAVAVQAKLEDVTGDVQAPLYLLMAAVLAVLLIACTNVAGLILTRAIRRSGEIALRTALGASQWRLWRQMLIESLLLAGCGGLLGALLAWVLLRLAMPWIPDRMPRMNEVGVDARVLWFTVGISLACALLSSVVPARKLTRAAPIDALREQGRHATAGRRTRWLQNTLMVMQTTLAVALLIGSGFLIRGFVNLRNVKTGFRSDHLLTFLLPLTEVRYPHATRALFYHALFPKLAAIPGVRSVSGGHPLPLYGGCDSAPVEIDGRPNPPGHALDTLVGIAEPGLFETLGVPPLRGRLFTEADDNAKAPLVAVVNQTFAKRYFPDENPVGQVIRPDIRELRNQAKEPDPRGDEKREIVGVVADTLQDSLIDPPQPFVLLPFAQASELMRPTLVMGVAGDPMQYEKAAAAAVAAIDPTLFLLTPQSMDMQLGSATGTQRFETWLIAGFSGIALLLACLGLYSMLATMVTARTREIGLRMAIGATRGDVAWMFLARVGVLLVGGIAAGGIVIALALRVVNSGDWSKQLLFGVSWSDPLTIMPMAVVFGVVALCGCLLPTWSAMRIDPARALHDE